MLPEVPADRQKEKRLGQIVSSRFSFSFVALSLYRLYRCSSFVALGTGMAVLPTPRAGLPGRDDHHAVSPAKSLALGVRYPLKVSSFLDAGRRPENLSHATKLTVAHNIVKCVLPAGAVSRFPLVMGSIPANIPAKTAQQQPQGGPGRIFGVEGERGKKAADSAAGA